MKRYKIQASFWVHAPDALEAKEIAGDMLGDMVSEQYENVERVTVLEEDKSWVDPLADDDEDDEDDDGDES